MDFSDSEFSALKALSKKPEKKWWNDYPFLVALMAFLLSLTTSLVSAYASHVHDVHEQQAQLSAAIETLQNLNFRSVEIHEKYKTTDFENLASRLINNEISSTLHAAAKLGLQLGRQAASADLAAVAEGLYGYADYETTEKLLKYARQSAETANDESITLRDLGYLYIKTGRGGTALKDGNQFFADALHLDQKYNLSGQPIFIMWIRSTALLSWAQALAEIDCPAAKKKFSDGISILLTAPSTIDFQQVRATAKQQWSGIGGISTCQPDPSTPTLP